jgi:Ni,Fe-hydrogenase III small subunit/ferredoxin
VIWLLRGLRNGILTSRWPNRADSYLDTFPAAVSVSGTPGADTADIAGLCPTEAIMTGGSTLAVDRGRCILCGACVDARPDLFEWALGSRTASLARDGMVVPALLETDERLAAVRAALARRVRRLRHSIHIRHIDTGSDGSDEWEVAALFNPVYDANRLGIFLTASPRHADILLVTGIGAAGMAAPLRRTLEAMPRPIVVIAAGADAVSGGIFRDSYAGHGGIADLVDVDVWVPGNPPSPFTLLHAILLATGRVPANDTMRTAR